MINPVGKEGRFKILWWLILILVFTIPISQNLSTKILLVATVYAVYVNIAQGELFKGLLLQAWDIYAYLLVLLIGLTYTQDMQTGWKVMETSLSFLAIPLIFNALRKFQKWNYEYVFLAFAAGVVIACLICVINATLVYLNYGDPQVFFSYDLTSIIHSHPTYLAYFIIFCITFGVYALYTERNVVPFPLIVVIVLFLFVVLMLTGGRTAFISILLIFSFFILKYLQETKTKIKTITFCFIILMVGGMFLMNTLGMDQKLGKNDSWERSMLWESAIKATPNVVLGVGTGDYKITLNDYYLSHNLSQYADSKLNSHNAFIEIFLCNGIVGLVFLLILLSRPLFIAVRHRNISGILTFFPFFIYGMTEVFLGRYQGVIFFVLLHQVLVVHEQQHAPFFSLKNG